MRRFALRWLANAALLLIIANNLHGTGGQAVFQVNGFRAALLAVALITLANVLVQPVAKVVASLGCLINLLTLGLYGWAISFVFYVVAFYTVGTLDIVEGFHVNTLQDALVGAFWLSVANALLSPLLDRRDDHDRGRDRDRRDERR